jgi:SAM-dependent methyltransferase
MGKIPTWLKRPILPAYNGAVHLARHWGEYAGAVLQRRFERCVACGLWAPMLYRRRVIPPRLVERWGLSPRLAEALARKESLDCARCGAKLRARRLARVLLDLYPFGGASSVREWAGRPEARTLRVAEINRIEGLHDALAGLPGLSYSEYVEGATPGTTREGVRCEDLTRLTYPDASFDLILTSETLEHVPDLGAALAEVLRVLAPGGRHLFTVPRLPGVPRTYRRQDDPPICHPGGDVGYPVFTEFGADLPEILGRSGLDEPRVHFGPATDDDLAQVYSCRKPIG